MKVIIEVEGGTVTGVYRYGRGPCNGAVIVDLDAAAVGEKAYCQSYLRPMDTADPKTLRIVNKLSR